MNTHLEHVEDSLFNEGSFQKPLDVLYEVFNFLKQESTNMKISVKWDGSPAFVARPHPENGKFFVGTKSAFSGVVNYTDEDIEKNYPDSGLQIKLKWLLKYLPEAHLRNVVHGDLLWYPGSLDIDEENVSFRPNTLRYSFSKNSEIGKFILGRPVGVLLHTTYTGESLSNLKPSFGVFGIPPCSFMEHLFCVSNDVLIPNKIGHQADVCWFEALFNASKNIIKDIDVCILWKFKNPIINSYTKKYINSCVRMGEQCNPNNYLSFLSHQYDLHLNSLKTQNGKEKFIFKFSQITPNFYSDELMKIFEYYNLLLYIKWGLLIYLDNHSNTEITLPDGEKCGHEGYVITSKELGTFKLVKRNVFSKANMNSEKVWKQ